MFYELYNSNLYRNKRRSSLLYTYRGGEGVCFFSVCNDRYDIRDRWRQGMETYSLWLYDTFA